MQSGVSLESIERLIKDTESQIASHRFSTAGGASASAGAVSGGLRFSSGGGALASSVLRQSSAATYNKQPSGRTSTPAANYELRREVGAIQNHVRSELETRMQQERGELAAMLKLEVEKSTAAMSSKMEGLRREVLGFPGDGSSPAEQVMRLEKVIEAQQGRFAAVEQQQSEDRQRSKADARDVQSQVSSQVLDVESDLKRQIQQLDTHNRELRSIVMEMERKTRDTVEEMGRQNKELVTQLKRAKAVLEHHHAHIAGGGDSAERVESQVLELQSRMVMLERSCSVLARRDPAAYNAHHAAQPAASQGQFQRSSAEEGRLEAALAEMVAQKMKAFERQEQSLREFM